jgi:3-phenylpropionate/cinnamic acid dioxygenase small subunit
MLALRQQVIIIYPDGTPKTKHVLSNPIIHIDVETGKVTSHSYYTVFQATENRALQVIAKGHYFDQFELTGGSWRFSYRDSQTDMLGDVSGHIRLGATLLKDLYLTQK